MVWPSAFYASDNPARKHRFLRFGLPLPMHLIIPFRMDLCFLVGCQNTGTCFNSLTYESYNCSCPFNYTGSDCELFIPCSTEPCQNNGTCANELDFSGYNCACTDEFTGIDCESFVPCSSSPCQHNQTCVNDGDFSGFTCDCDNFYTGGVCETPILCQFGPCVHGTCYDYPNFVDYFCDCGSDGLYIECYSGF